MILFYMDDIKNTDILLTSHHKLQRTSMPGKEMGPWARVEAIVTYMYFLW